MGKLDEVKETLNSLRGGLAILSALMMALGGAAGNMHLNGQTGVVFWMSIIALFAAIAGGFFIILKIKQKTKEIGEL